MPGGQKAAGPGSSAVPFSFYPGKRTWGCAAVGVAVAQKEKLRLLKGMGLAPI